MNCRLEFYTSNSFYLIINYLFFIMQVGNVSTTTTTVPPEYAESFILTRTRRTCNRLKALKTALQHEIEGLEHLTFNKFM